MARVQISIDNDVLKRVDEFSKKSGLSRSSFLSMAALDYIESKEKAPLISSAFASMASLLDARVNGLISQEEFDSKLTRLGDDVKLLRK